MRSIVDGSQSSSLRASGYENYSPGASPTVSSSVHENVFSVEYAAKSEYVAEAAVAPVNYSLKQEPIYEHPQQVFHFCAIVVRKMEVSHEWFLSSKPLNENHD